MEYKTTKYTTSVGTLINNPKIMEAKIFLKEKYGNKYDIDPHFNFIIMAMPKYRQKDLESTLNSYLSKKEPIKLELGELNFEPKSRFFSIPILGDEVMEFHKELLNLLNNIRDNYIREKDLARINEGRTDVEETDYIHRYGYLRVLNMFKPHITIGNIQNDNGTSIDEIEKQLKDILAIFNTTMMVNTLHASLIEDAHIQSDYKWLWEKDYLLTE